MTGYGKSQKEVEGRVYQVETRGINSKTLDLNCRLPAEYRDLEPAWRTEIASVLQRGKVECTLSVTSKNADAARLFHINFAQVESYRQEIGEWGARNAVDASAYTLSHLLELPGAVYEKLPQEIDEDERAMLFSLLQESLRKTDQSRLQEGKVLAQDLRLRVRNIENLAKEVESFEAGRVPAIRRRMEEHLSELRSSGIQPDANRLEQEMIYYLEKLDITEEKVRLARHCRYFTDTMEEDAAGRKLAFIAQEMGREINTLGSKANDADIQKLVVRMKDELEKIKEQLFNIL